MDEQCAIHQWRSLGTIYHGDKLIVTLTISIILVSGCLSSAEKANVKPKTLKGTQTQEKNDLLMQNGVDYNALPDMFRRGSCVFWDEENNEPMEVGSKQGSRKRIVIDHCNIIDDTFWEAHPWILGDKYLPKGHC